MRLELLGLGRGLLGPRVAPAARRALAVAGLVLWLPLFTAAEEATPEPVGPPAAPQPPAETGYPVTLDGEVVFHLGGEYVGGFSPEERVVVTERSLLRIARDPFYTSGLFTVEPTEGGVWVLYRGERIGLIRDEIAALLGTTASERAAKLIGSIEEAVTRYRERRRPQAWARSIVGLALATGALVGALLLVRAAHRRLAARVEAQARSGVTVGGRRLGFHTAERFEAFQLRTLRLGRALAYVVVAIVYLQAAFAIFPLTRGYALGVLGYVLDPLEVLWLGFLERIGDLFFIAVVVVLARLLLRALRVLLTEAAFGVLRLPGIPRDRAVPLYKILRLVIIAITVVMVYPYIPGSSSAAFHGISLFAGALFTLGASSTASNFIGGMVLVFSGAFQVGDRVKIAGVVGDVEESTLALTRIRTPKNELVTFANSTVLGESFVNYSALARKQGLIVHTEVTIGYDAPWRKVHELLVQAARRTEGVLEQPAPFALQTALNDFHVAYEINAYTREANAMARIRSELHQNVQDAFAEAGVEILSPGYTAVRGAAAAVVPKRTETS